MRTLEDPGCLEELEQRLDGFNPDSARAWGRMTPHQAVCHLADAYRVMMGLKAAESMENWMGRTVIRVIALYLPLPWPKGLKTTHACDAEGGMTRPVEFARDRTELRELLRRFVSEQPPFPGARHPMMGELTRWERMRWAYLHTDHHLRQFGL
jgi:hypothetical protein